MDHIVGEEWLAFAIAAAVSLVACISVILTKHWHGRLSLDHDIHGAQKLHTQPVPRVGGVGIAIGLFSGGAALFAMDSPAAQTALLLTVCSIPAFAAGLLEDLTKRVSVRNRLMASFVSGGMAIWMLDATLTNLDTPGLDTLMQISPIAMLFTCFAVGGVTNAVNIIDGLNGLASGATAIMLGGLGAIAWMHGDTLVLVLCLLGIGAIGGFVVLNYLSGQIFMGDGGAYLAGFWLAECAVLLLTRNPGVSTWAPLLCCIYPVWETGFSMYRRHIVDRVSSGVPDMKHMHHLVLRRLVAPRFQGSAVKQHRIASALIWFWVALCQLVAATNSWSTYWLISGMSVFVTVYLCTYLKLEQGYEADQQSISQHVTP